MSFNKEFPTPVQINVCSGSKLSDGIFGGQQGSEFSSLFRGPVSGKLEGSRPLPFSVRSGQLLLESSKNLGQNFPSFSYP